ncbi:MAG: multidrug ABC transporter ATP-binding protein [Candidatus Lumbricidophila eiseniae]|uniref:Multidrug ABC transporter ATP-binding protein n=1 Tax=Candidatus Lumbricidiphila eiseniae TaxID=1969409 RepID=A0A2A6FPE3_9MICO|nr:MAG: multidrug ABC transporter ATP-binding protein [Candidatus Lumbricidophila eiseniae]
MLLTTLTRYLRPYRPLLLGVLVFQVLSVVGTLWLPNVTKQIINDGVAKGDTKLIWSLGFLMLLVSFAQITASIIATYFAAKAAMRAGRDMRDDIFERVSGFSEREISKFGAGSLITRNTNDVQQVQMVAMTGGTFLISAPLLALGGIVMAVVTDFTLSWLIAIAVPAMLVMAILIIGRMVPLFRSYQGKLDNVNRVMREQLTGIRVIRAFVREDIEASRFRGANDEILVTGRKIGSLFVLLFPLFMLILNVTLVAVLWFGASEIDRGAGQVGTIFAFMAYVMQILMGVLMASFMMMMIPRAAVSAERISEVLTAPVSLERPSNPISSFTSPGSVEFVDASFTYPGAEHPVLNGVSFRVNQGETVAIIGSTGAGKTTMISLIPRLFDVTSGAIKIGGVDVREADLDAVWKTLGFVPQRPFLFQGTVASNLRFGREEATDDDLWAALEIAQAKDFVAELEGGLNAKITQGGTNVSGGQRQRLAIARAIVHQPEILLFDDSFSALDLTTDARLRQALWQELPGVTKIIVAQRVSTVTDADRIIVLEDSRIVGNGQHDELLATCDTYREIVESQLGVGAAS